MDSDDFFGFDTAQPHEEDAGQSYDCEDDIKFDALNDETFGTAANTGDWENQHVQLSSLVEQNRKPSATRQAGADVPDSRGVNIPGSAGDGAESLYGSNSLTNGLSNLHIGAGNGTPGREGAVGSYSTPPKPSLIDPVKLSESPGNGIWAPEPAMLEKIGRGRNMGGSNNSSSGPASNIFNLLQQSSSGANQQQINIINHAQQQQQQMMFANNGSSAMLSGVGQDNSGHPSGLNNQQQQLLMSINSLAGGGGGGSLGGLECPRPGGLLPPGFSRSVKSVADLGMEMRLQQLKNNANVSDKIVGAEDLERQPARPSNNLNKPLQPFFTEQQQLQQIKQNQLVEIQQKRPHQQQQQHSQGQQQHHHSLHLQQQQMQQQHRLAQIHPLTGQPLNTGPGGTVPPPGMNPLHRMPQQPPHNIPPNYPNFQYLQHQQQQQLLMANMNKRTQMNHGSAPVPPPHLNQNYHNFPNNQRNSYNNYTNSGGGYQSSNNSYGTRSNNSGSNWNSSDYDNSSLNSSGGGHNSFFDRRNAYNNNNRSNNMSYGSDMSGRRSHDHSGMSDRSGGYERSGSGCNMHRDYPSNMCSNCAAAAASGGRPRRDSEAEWEEWERKRQVDPYAGLMTPKQKSWLRNIQTMQLSTDHPYRDDYYYVMYRAKRNRVHPDAPLNIQGLNMLLPALTDHDKDQGNTYQPPAMENSLGKLQVASVNAPRKIMDLQVVHLDASEPTTPLQQQMRTHRLKLLNIENLYGQLMELEDMERKVAYLPDSPTRDTLIKSAKALSLKMWNTVNKDEAHLLSIISVRKGTSLAVQLVNRVGPSAAESLVCTVLTKLPHFTRIGQSHSDSNLTILWPVADKLLATCSSKQLLEFASRITPHLLESSDSSRHQQEDDDDVDMPLLNAGSSSSKEKDLPLVLASKFGISVIVGLLVRGEHVLEVTKHSVWQAFLLRTITLLANVENPDLITRALAKDSPAGDKRPPVVVLGRGQSLSSLTKQRSSMGVTTSVTKTTAPGRLTPTLPLLAVTAAGGSSSITTQPITHLARCTEPMQTGALVAAQSALQKLEITTPRTKEAVDGDAVEKGPPGVLSGTSNGKSMAGSTAASVS